MIIQFAIYRRTLKSFIYKNALHEKQVSKRTQEISFTSERIQREKKNKQL